MSRRLRSHPPHDGRMAPSSTASNTDFTFNAGLRAKIVPDLLAVGVSYNHSVRVDGTGTGTLNFNCPPASLLPPAENSLYHHDSD